MHTDTRLSKVFTEKTLFPQDRQLVYNNTFQRYGQVKMLPAGR